MTARLATGHARLTTSRVAPRRDVIAVGAVGGDAGGDVPAVPVEFAFHQDFCP